MGSTSDCSGSFKQLLIEDGKAFEFLTHVINQYFQNQVGTSNRLVIGQISGPGSQALVWDGTPLELRQKFDSPEKFREFLLSKVSDENSSLVYRNLRLTLEYILNDPSVQAGKARPVILCLSDLLDSGSDAKEEEHLNHYLSVLGMRGGSAGFYYVDQEKQLLPWRHKLSYFKVPDFVVESTLIGKPRLPSVE